MKRSKLSEVDCLGRNSRTKGSKVGVQFIGTVVYARIFALTGAVFFSEL